jgi:rhodanese-related sulfurtransferase
MPTTPTIVDFRPSTEFNSNHIRGSRSIPLPSTKRDFYADASAVEKRWRELTEAFEHEAWVYKGEGPVLALCGDGDTGRMATSILRARGREAFCVEGGFEALAAGGFVDCSCERL